MSPAATGKGVSVTVPSQQTRSSLLRLVRMAVAFVVVAGSLGLATVTATAQSGGSSCPSGTDNYSDVVAGSTHANDIACLKELGIPAPGNTYRPGADMTRSEMARFMAGAYRVLTGSPAPVVEHDFTDVAGDANEDDIARIAGLKITTGTTPTTYAPDAPVIRGHMALFLTRLYKVVAGRDAPTGATAFTDIGRRSAEQRTAIGQIFALRVTTGTTRTTYSPTNHVTRDQMASFVARIYRVLDALETVPGAPTGVAAEASGSNGDALEISWTAPDRDDVTGYVVQWKSGDDDFTADNEKSVDGTSTTLDDLTKGTSYTVRVAAVSDAGQGGWSDEASGTPATVPGAVSDFTATAADESLELAWAAPDEDGGSPVTGYLVQWSADRGALQKTEVDAAATSYTIRDLRNDQRYSVWIQAANAVGVGTITAPAGQDGSVGSISPSPVAAGAPANLTAATGRADFNREVFVATELDLSWSEPVNSGGANFIDFDVAYRCGTNVAWTASPGSPVPHVSTTRVYQHTITGLTPGVRCEVRVRANSYSELSVPANNRFDQGTDKELTGPWATVSATPARAPGAPTDIEVTNAYQALHVTWAAPVTPGGANPLPGDAPNTGGSPITGYEITWDDGGSATVGPAARSYTVTGLDTRYNYTVAVKTVNAAGKSAAGTAIQGRSLTVKPEAVNAAPRNVVAVPPPVFAGVTHADDTLKVSWDAPVSNGTAPAHDYLVQYREAFVPAIRGVRGTTPAGAWSTTGVATVDRVNRKVDITGLNPGTRYEVRVQAVNRPDLKKPTVTANGPWATSSGTPATVPYKVVVAREDVETGYTSLNVRWAPPNDNETGGSPITHYLVRYAISEPGELFSSDIRVNAPTTRITISGLRTNTNYVVQVQAVNASGKGPSSDETTGFTAGVPSPPASVRAVSVPTTIENATGNSLRVSWPAVTQSNGGGTIAGYLVQYRPVSETGVWTTEPWSTTDVVIPDERRQRVAVITGLIEGQHYLVRVRATANNPGSSAYSPVVKSEGVPIVGPNFDQHNLGPRVSINTAVSRTTLNVEWNSIAASNVQSNVTGYQVRWYPSTPEATSRRGTVNVPGKSTSSYAITGLTPGFYTVAVSAVNRIGSSEEILAVSDFGRTTIEVPPPS